VSIENQPTMAKAYVFGNGMVIAFDQYGEQMPDYQGRFEDVAEKIIADFPSIQIRAGEMAE
jgi:hypothetical protein